MDDNDCLGNGGKGIDGTFNDGDDLDLLVIIKSLFLQKVDVGNINLYSVCCCCWRWWFILVGVEDDGDNDKKEKRDEEKDEVGNGLGKIICVLDNVFANFWNA